MHKNPPYLYKIYRSRRHLAVTFLFIVLPILFLLAFAQFTGITIARLFSDIGSSFARLTIAYLCAALLGWVLAVLFFRGKRAAVALPAFDVLQSFPTFAALPLAAYFWGRSDFTVVFFLVITIIWPIFFSVTSSLKLIRRDWDEAAAIAGLSGGNYLRRFIIPVTMPGLVTGSIIGLGEGWEALIATEIIVGLKEGLGEFFIFFSRSVPVTAFGILGFLLLIFSINKLLWLPLLERSHRRLEE
ncbi:MAG: ABC transporter permease subunit [bacterium]|nr:ABC transporter permease subunit [bacterium]